MTSPSHTFLWLLTQHVNQGMNTFDACVVAADTAQEAINIHPHEHVTGDWAGSDVARYSWARFPNQVTAEQIGVTKLEHKGKVIISSFNAG